MFLGESANRLHLPTIQKPDAESLYYFGQSAGYHTQMFEN